MTAQWVLVADSTQARVLERRKTALVQVDELTHPQSREQGPDLMGNRPGENQHSMDRDNKGDETQALRDDESRRFAHEVAGFLSTAHSRNRFAELVIVADPRFLGMLRKEVAKPVADRVTSSINKNAVQLSPEDVDRLVAQG
jgi:protein required for attachment to host cells